MVVLVHRNCVLSLKIPHAAVIRASLSRPIRRAGLNEFFRTGWRNPFDAVMRAG